MVGGHGDQNSEEKKTPKNILECKTKQKIGVIWTCDRKYDTFDLKKTLYQRSHF